MFVQLQPNYAWLDMRVMTNMSVLQEAEESSSEEERAPKAATKETKKAAHFLSCNLNSERVSGSFLIREHFIAFPDISSIFSAIVQHVLSCLFCMLF